MSTTAAAMPLTGSGSPSSPTFRSWRAEYWAIRSSVVAWRAMSMVSTALSPGFGSFFHSWLVVFPSWSFSMSREPLTPWSCSSKANSTPSTPTVASMG